MNEFWVIASLAVAAVTILLHSWWIRVRFRHQQEQARQDYTRAALERQQQATAQAQAQIEALFNSMTEGVLVLGQDGRIQLFNESLRGLLHSSQDLRGMSIMEAFRLHELDALARRLIGECTVLDTELELPAAPPRYVQINGSAVLDKQGGQRGAILVFHDVTRLRQLENARQEFVANVSHELRTPLTLIRGFVETLQNGALEDPAHAGRFLAKIDKHANRLSFLIEDLLTISRLESGRAVLNLQPTGLREVAARVVEDLQGKAAEKRITLRNDIPAALAVQADGDRLQQVFFNLVDNAIKHGRPDGGVWITAPLTGDTVRVCVRDDGPGIPAESCERVFERFYRLDKARTRDAGGTGLGLSIVKHIVQCHGGRVWVESTQGSGASFWFTLSGAGEQSAVEKGV